MNAHAFPERTANAIKIEKLIKMSDKRFLSDRMSTRMVKCASVLKTGSFLGWQMTVPVKGSINISLFGTKDLSKSDLEWIAEKTGKVCNCSLKNTEDSFGELYELYLPIATESLNDPTIGFGAKSIHHAEAIQTRWPTSFSSQFDELIRGMQKTGGALRVVVGAASESEKMICKKHTIHHYDVSGVNATDYIGNPVKIKVLLRIPDMLSIRLQTVFGEAVHGSKIQYLGKMNDDRCAEIWANPLETAQTLPDYAARIIIMEPELKDSVIGIGVCEEEMKIIPSNHKNPKSSGAVRIGKSIDTSGKRQSIKIGELDLRRHYQIIGQTGTGKSTLLSNIILDAIKQGHGLTFFDPHGSTINTIIRCLPEKYADKVRIIRIGDVDNPVPLNIWDSDDPEQESRNISNLCELFSDIFDPKKEGFVGPRYERWLSTFSKASIACLGRRASLESIAVISQSQDNMLKVYKSIANEYPELAERIKQEYGLDKSSDFHATLSWYLCKFERLTSVEQLRKTLGAGTNALDFANTIDTDTVTLIDLASPVIGAQASRIIGTLLMMKLWNAAMERRKRERLHMVIVDEASLFQTNPMPRMLAESRKFGISMCLCHQHLGQLTSEIREALEANSANFSAFRLSPRDAAIATVRFDSPEMQANLTRLDAFNAITTISVNGRQTAPFTLKIDRLKKQKNAEVIAKRIETESIKKLVAPYRYLRALTPSEIMQAIEHKIEQKTEHKPAREDVPGLIDVDSDAITTEKCSIQKLKTPA